MQTQLPPLTHTIDGVDFTFIHVPEGFYLRGKTPEQGNQHEIFSRLPLVEMDIAAFYLQQTPVTVAQYSLFVQELWKNKHSSDYWGCFEGRQIPQKGGKELFWYVNKWGLNIQGLPQQGYENHPMQNVTSGGAVAFTDWLSQKMESTVRLPTEAEWEYAAKGGQFRDSFRYAGSDNLEEVGWYSENSANKTQEVAKKKKNVLGIYDLSGSVWEWCKDEFEIDMLGGGTGHVLRGGSWHNMIFNCFMTNRLYKGTTFRDHDMGFRCAISPI